MRQIKEPKLIEVIANIRYEEKEDVLVQKISFVVPNKKYLPYLFDARFLFKNKIEKLIKDNLLKGFIRRIDDIDNIEIIYEKQEFLYYFTTLIMFFLPFLIIAKPLDSTRLFIFIW